MYQHISALLFRTLWMNICIQIWTMVWQVINSPRITGYFRNNSIHTIHCRVKVHQVDLLWSPCKDGPLLGLPLAANWLFCPLWGYQWSVSMRRGLSMHSVDHTLKWLSHTWCACLPLGLFGWWAVYKDYQCWDIKWTSTI